jgi:hypothetical protein
MTETNFVYKKKVSKDRQIIVCNKPDCCYLELKLEKDISSPTFHRCYKGSQKSATSGVFIIDYEKMAILFVQSYGKHWGPPKGGKEDNEIPQDTACRELYEETGISLDKNLLNRRVKIKGNIFYIVAYNKVKMDILKVKGTEISGIGWFSINCLIKNFSTISDILNTYGRYFIRNYNNIIYGKSSFIPFPPGIPQRFYNFQENTGTELKKRITILFDECLEITIR